MLSVRECIIVKGGEKLSFSVCNYTVSAKHIMKWTFAIVYSNTYDETSVQSEWNFLSDVIYSKSVFLKHVQCSRICLNGGVSFITFRVHVYKIL